MIKKYSYLILFAITTLTGFLYGCGKENDFVNDGTGITISGNMATLTFRVNESLPEEAYTRASFQCDTVRQQLNDSLMIETVISPDYGMPTRASEVKNNVTNTTMLVLVESETRGKFYKCELANVDNGKLTIHLPVGETYKLYLLAVNGVKYANAAAAWSSFNGYLTGTWTDGGDSAWSGGSKLAGDNAGMGGKNGETTRDLICATTTSFTVSGGAKLPAIELKHQFCQTKLTLQSSTGGEAISAWEATVGPQAYQEANDISFTFGSWTGGGTRQDIKLTNADIVPKLFIPQTSGDITLKYDKVVIGGRAYKSNTPITINKKFEKGHRYLFTGTVKKPVVYNLTVNTSPTGITTPTITPSKDGYTSGENVTVSVPDRVTYNGNSYKFLDWSVSPTSLSVGIGHEITVTMPSSNVVLTANYLEDGGSWITTFKGWALGDLVLTDDGKLVIGDASKEGPAFRFGSLIGVDIQTGNILFKPTEYTGEATHAQNVPYITTTKSPENSNSNDIAGMTNAVQGIGDICLYASQKWPENFDHKLWRMPSNTEFKNDLGSGTYKGSPAVYTFKDATGGSMQMYCWGYWYGVNNSVMWRNSYGPRWTATMSTKPGKFSSGSPAAYVVALGSGVYPDYPWGRNSAFNIRCVLFDK